jgi:hypothetical protein
LTTQSTGSAFVAGTSYSVLLKAVNVEGDSSASSASNSVTACTVPQAPQSVSSSWTVGGYTVTTSFTPGNNGGSAITYYELGGFPLGAGGTSTSSPISFTGLPPFAWPSNQVFYVYAYNAGGSSQPGQG